MSAPHASTVAALRARLGGAAIGARDDGAVVVTPPDAGAVAATVRICAAAGCAIVPQGGDTGLSHGTALPSRPAVVLSTAALDTIESIDPARWTVTAQAGVTIEAVQDAAAGVGRAFAPDWGARGSATVGGAVSTDAGGTNTVRWGTMRDHVLGLQVVLADGRVWDGRRALRKDSSGVDLTQLFVGAEGTLGIVTSVVLRLVPATPHRQSALAALADLDRLDAVVARLLGAGDGTVTAIELVPDRGLRMAAGRLEVAHPMPDVGEHHLLISLAGAQPVTDRLTGLLADAAEAGEITDAVVADTAEQESLLWRLRDLQSPSQLAPELVEAALKYDAAVPLDAVGTLVRRAHHLVDELTPGAHAHTFGHAGDGNIHIWVLPDAATDFPARRDVLRRAIDELVIGLGGTLSAEHGIGALLRDRIGPQKSALEWELLHRVKATFDPGGVFNPEKTIPDTTARSDDPTT